MKRTRKVAVMCDDRRRDWFLMQIRGCVPFTLGVIGFALMACSAASTSSSSPNAPGSAADRGVSVPVRMDVVRPDARGGAAPSAVIAALRTEHARATSALARDTHSPYFIAYQVTDRDSVSMTSAFGALVRSDRERGRTLDVDVRVGDYKLDNTHPLGGDIFANYSRFDSASWSIPITDDPATLRPTIWIATHRAHRVAVADYLKVKGNSAVKAQQEDESNDFSREQPVRYLERPVSVDFDRQAWQDRVRGYSRLFRDQPALLTGNVVLQIDGVNRFLVNTDGSEVQVGRLYVRLAFSASARAEDGMEVSRYDSIEIESLAAMPPDEVVHARIRRVIADTVALRVAPVADPYVGPAILEGEAAGVYFHEIFGHRVEGHRQRDDDEGQTFARKVNQRIMPTFVDVYDDPTIRTLNGVQLNGFYRVDDEGVRTRRVNLVESGVLKTFLLSRAPTRGFAHSNGHGRRQEGRVVVARQGSLVVHPRVATTAAHLKQMLLAEVRRQAKPYGLRFGVVQGGFTNTTRLGTQTFKVMPIVVYRVFPDGREELIRGVDIDGTPLTSLSLILAASNDVKVFNGMCGAESGFVPVSAVSPSLLISKVEVSRRMNAKVKPPILPPPSMIPGGAQ